MAKDPEDPDDPGDPRSSWPPFLDLLDEDPDRAGRLFFNFFMRAVRACPPSPLKYYRRDDREDALQRVLVAFIDRNFRRLRLYENKGGPFFAWMYTVTERLLLDRIPPPPHEELPGTDPPGENGRDWVIRDPGVQERIWGAVDRLGHPCSALIKAKYQDDLKNREIVLLFPELGLDNKQIDGKIRDCARELRRRFKIDGLDRNSFQDYL